MLVLIIACLVFLFDKGKEETKVYDEIRSEAINTKSHIESTNISPKVENHTDIAVETKESLAKENTSDLLAWHDVELQINYEKMKEINPEYKCWINIPGTKISYPVVMTADNEYYLHRTFDTKEYSYGGTLFIDAYSPYMLNQKNLIIYGHNMKNGTMFGRLRDFNDADFFEKHKYIEIYTKDESRVYMIFSVREVASDINSLDFALDDFIQSEYVENARKKSIQYRDVDLEGQIITLATCVGDSSIRLLVSGIRIQ